MISFVTRYKSVGKCILNKGKRNYDINNITKLKTTSGNIVTSHTEISKVQVNFYKNLYDNKLQSNEFYHFFLDKISPLSIANIDICDKELTLDELAVKMFKKRSAQSCLIYTINSTRTACVASRTCS